MWDPAGDSFVYFDYQRPHPSFLVKSSILEQTTSDEHVSKLRDGYRRTVQRESTPQQPSQSALLGIKNVSLKDSSRRQGVSITAPEVQVSHEIHFPAPGDASRIEIPGHYLTTHNLFTLLMNRPLVGLTFYQALVDLQERLETIMPEGVSSAQYLIRALIQIHLHNVSNDTAAAAGLLASSENVFSKEGWREAFVHCTGTYSQLREMPELRDISHVTCGLLERASLEFRVKLQEIEDRLSTFNFEDMWSNQGAGFSHASFNHFRQFLAQFYEKAYKAWPPRSTCWLTRDVILKLQKHFGSLYNYYVDPDIVWDETDHHMIRKTDQAPMWTTNHELCLERFFTILDSRNRYPHIPNRHPLLPISVPVSDTARSQQKTPLFSTKSKALEKRILLASHEASNTILQSEDVTSNPLVEAFLRFDKSDRLGDEDPRDVRRQRWVLLYGILQVLSSISIEPPHLWFKSNVPYFLNPRMKGTPRWKTDDSYDEPARGAGHAWLLPKSSVR